MQPENEERLAGIRAALAETSRPALHPAITEKLRAGQPLSPEQQKEYSAHLLSKNARDLTSGEVAYLRSGVNTWLREGDPEQ